MDSNGEKPVSWGRWFGEHVAGTATVAAIFAGIGGARAWSHGTRIRSGVVGGALLGGITGLGFGRTVYAAIAKRKRNDYNSDSLLHQATLWTDRVRVDSDNIHSR